MVELLDRDGLEERVDFLRQPGIWPDGTDRVDVVETHLSWVFLTRRYAWKLKKPVRYLKQDLRSYEARRSSAETETRLNRRLAPDIYLGVATLARRPDGELALEAPGRPVDALVWMLRLPADDLLDGAMRRGAARPERLAAAADLVADFYLRAPPVPMTPDDYLSRLRGVVDENRAGLLRSRVPLPPGSVEQVHDAQRRWLDRERALVGGRAARVVEAHGDLRPEHVYLGTSRGDFADAHAAALSRPAFIDCLEFDRDLRLLDPVDELGFLAVASERLGGPSVGPVFLDVYRRRTGDRFDPPLLAFYQSIRAATRARLAATRSEEDGEDVPRWTAATASWLALAAARCDGLAP